MKYIKDYINLSKEERQKHIDLSESCIERGGNSTEFRGLLAYYLNTNIPKNKIALCCHACHNGNCSNPKHLYWGTFKENFEDAVENGRNKNVWNLRVNKNGLDVTNEENRNKRPQTSLSLSGRNLSKEHKENISNSLKNKCVNNYGKKYKEHKREKRSNSKWINKNNKNKLVDKNLISEYLEQGWKLGMLIRK